MRKIDLLSLKIYRTIVREYEENIDKNGPYLNIFGIFFHEIMLYLTNYTILKESKYRYGEAINFPFLNTEYIQKPFPVFPHANFPKVSALRKIPEWIFFLSRGEKQIAYTDTTYKEQIGYLLKNIFKYSISKSKFTKCYIANKNEQMNLLASFLMSFSKENQIGNPDIFVENFLSYVGLFLQDEEITITQDILLIGSNVILLNRINAATFLSQGKKVISSAHGEADIFMIDEPIVGYGDLSYCTHYINFGSNIIDHSIHQYCEPLKDHSVNILYRKSEIVSVKSDNKVIGLPQRGQPGLYIPTGFSANARYGPFRDIDDDEYTAFQEALFSQDIDLSYKEHPANKQKKTFSNTFVSENKILYNNLKNVDFDKYNFIILDYLTTAFIISTASRLPILYLHLGLRNFPKEVEDAIKKRVFWIDVDMKKNLDLQISDALNSFFAKQRLYDNSLVSEYSVSPNSLDHILDRLLADD